MRTSDTGSGTANRSIVLESDVVVLKEIFPDTAEVDIKRALEMGLGSRLNELGNARLPKRREGDEESQRLTHRDKQDRATLFCRAQPYGAVP